MILAPNSGVSNKHWLAATQPAVFGKNFEKAASKHCLNKEQHVKTFHVQSMKTLIQYVPAVCIDSPCFRFPDEYYPLVTHRVVFSNKKTLKKRKRNFFWKSEKQLENICVKSTKRDVPSSLSFL